MMIQLPQNHLPATPPSDHASMEIAALQRRRALLQGLGKGSVAATALLPLLSHANRNYKLHNPDLSPTPGDAYCSISGFHSAVVSAAPGSVITCVAYKPTSLFNATTAYYIDAAAGPHKKRIGIQTMMLAKFGLTVSDANADTLKNVGGKVIISGKIYEAVASSTLGGSIRELKASTIFPTSVGSVTPTADFLALMGQTAAGTIVGTMLYTLFLAGDNAYFAAAYLSCVKEDNAINPPGAESGSIPFSARYVADNYTTVGAANFFRKLCTL